MPLQKELKINNESINSISEENKTAWFQMKKWLLKHRRESRNKLSFNNLNFTTFLTILPVALAFSQFFTQHIRSGKTDFFFQKNVPLLTNFQPRLGFETFDYIVKSNQKVFESRTDKMRFCQLDTTFLFDRPDFLGTIKKRLVLDRKKFSGVSCDFYLISSGNFVSKKFSLNEFNKNLDELPCYVKGLNFAYPVSEPLDFILAKKNRDTTNTVLIKQGFVNSLDFLKKQPATDFTKTETDISQNKLRLVHDTEFKTQQSIIKPSEDFDLQTQFSKNRFEFYLTLNQLSRELQSFFIEKANNTVESIFDEKELKSLHTFLNQKSSIEDIILSTKLFQHFEKNQISPELENFRSMSGYKYPDMTSRDLFWFSFFNKQKPANSAQKKVFTKKHSSDLSPETFNFPLSCQTYTFNIKNLPSILIETKNLLLKDLYDKKIIYNQPSVLLDPEKAFDWKTHGKKNLRSWFQSYMSPLNSLVQFQENFFGNYYSPQFGLDTKNPQVSDFTNKSFLRLKFSKKDSAWVISHDSSQSNFVPFESSLHITSNSKNFHNSSRKLNLKGIYLNLSKNDDLGTSAQFLPLIQLTPPNFSSSKRTSMFLEDSTYSPIFDFGVKGNPDYTLSPEFLSQKSFVAKRASGQYKKMSSLFSKTSISSSVFVDNWEPLTVHSWLVVSQLSFAVFIFHILKSLSDNYGRELLGYLLDLVAALGFVDDSVKKQIQLLMGDRNKGFRVVLKSQKNFNDIVGIQKLLPEISEVFWFLRTAARDLTLGKSLPRGILLTGPPGTGKTLLVRALAGEAQVPVIVLSGSSLIKPRESGADKLSMVFQEARQFSPCIVFIDEIDTLSAKRHQVTQNPMGADEVLESVLSLDPQRRKASIEMSSSPLETLETETQAESSALQPQLKVKQLSLLTQLLIELDGIHGREGVIVIGATNRLDSIDPALLRPGRFDTILQVGLPTQKKRVEILQFYGQNLGYPENIPWNYLGDRTAGFTAADLATLMNESTIKAILNQSKHTIETIEHGIDRLTTSESEKYSIVSSFKKSKALLINSKMTILRFAYYQAGKIVVSHILETHPKSVFASLWPRRPTFRSIEMTTNLQNSVFNNLRLREFTDRLVGCYAGKAAEVLFLEKFSASVTKHSTLGLDDFRFAQKLVYSLLENWGVSKKSQIQKILPLRLNLNLREFRKTPDKLDLYNELVKDIEKPPMEKIFEQDISWLELKKGKQKIKVNEQTYYQVAWWQQEIFAANEFRQKNFANGTRLYLYNSERNERNPEWVPPDEVYHRSSGLKNVKKANENLKQAAQNVASPKPESFSMNSSEKRKSAKVYFSWNEIPKITRDYPAHSLVLQSFNKALDILNTNRELLDRLVIELLYHEILRKPEVENLLKEYHIQQITTFEGENKNFENIESVFQNPFEKKKSVEIVELSWGPYSRKPLPRWIDFAELRG